jgi:methylated-DNA-protein-cysteine methyltransferase-like protein
MSDTQDNEQEQLRRQVMKLALEIPRGRVISYGALGKRCDPPISGYICGRVMSQILDDVPWWRIVGKDGALPISKRGPYHALKQRDLLTEEGVEFDENSKILRRFFEDDQQTLF